MGIIHDLIHKTSRYIPPSYQQLSCSFGPSPPFSYETMMKEKPKLLDQVRQVIRVRNYSYRTEKAYSAGSIGTSTIMTFATRPRWERLRQKRF